MKWGVGTERHSACFEADGPELVRVTCPDIGIGDVVAGATKAAGVKPCAGCRKRRAALNALTPRWVGRLFAGIQAIVRALRG